MDILLNILVSFGLISVGIAFIILLPTVGQTLVAVFSTVIVEQIVSRFRNQESGTVMSVPVVPTPKPVVDDDPHGPTPIGVYVSVYLGLVVLTGVTVGVSELGLPMKQSIFWAVVVASTKATLVVAWFMHVRGGPAINRLVLGTSVFFVGVFFTLTMADLSTRGWLTDEESHLTLIKESMDDGQTPTGWSNKAKEQP